MSIKQSLIEFMRIKARVISLLTGLPEEIYFDKKDAENILEWTEEAAKDVKNSLEFYIFRIKAQGLSSGTCPFCLYYRKNCNSCSYVNQHGGCYEKDSDFKEINRVLRKKNIDISNKVVRNIFRYSFDKKKFLQEKLIAFMKAKAKVLKVGDKYFNKDDEAVIRRWDLTTLKKVHKHLEIAIFVFGDHGLTEDLCPFCQAYDSCDDCPYEIYHGRCSEVGSDYQVYAIGKGFSPNLTRSFYKKLWMNTFGFRTKDFILKDYIGDIPYYVYKEGSNYFLIDAWYDLAKRSKYLSSIEDYIKKEKALLGGEYEED